MAKLIDRDDPQWEPLIKVWLAEKKPGYVVTASGASYRVLQPSEGEVKFELMEGIDSLYNSRSTTRIVR